jgi:hypothetical protein
MLFLRQWPQESYQGLMKEIHCYPISWLSEWFAGKKGNRIGLRTGNNGQQL